MVKVPWNRNRTRPATTQVPAEVEEYYQSTRKERTGIAWLLALATLLLTLLIAAGLFFGGRWLYRTITGKDEPQTTSTTQPAEQAPKPEDANNTTQAPSTNTNNQQNSSTNPGANVQGSTPSGSTNTGATTPTTGPDSPEIPHTGPTSND